MRTVLFTLLQPDSHWPYQGRGSCCIMYKLCSLYISAIYYSLFIVTSVLELVTVTPLSRYRDEHLLVLLPLECVPSLCHGSVLHYFSTWLSHLFQVCLFSCLIFSSCENNELVEVS